MKIKKLMIATLLVSVIALPTIAFAKSQGYSSYLYLPSNEQVEGDSRSYDYSNYKVNIQVDSVYQPASPTIVVVSLNKRGIFSNTQYERKDAYYGVGQNLEVALGNHGSGKKWYGFGAFANALKDGNSGHGMVYAGIRSENVVMSSYE